MQEIENPTKATLHYAHCETKNGNCHANMEFLILIGFMLIIEAAHLSHTVIFNNTIGSIPKGYLYFAIAFSLGVEFLNMRIARNNRKKS